MDKNTERIERYLEGIVPPVRESDPHRRQLRRRVLTELARRNAMSINGRTWKTAAVIAAVLCTAAAAAVVGVTIHQYYFAGQTKDGDYLFFTEPEAGYEVTYNDADGVTRRVGIATMGSVSLSPDEEGEANVEQMQRDLAEIEILRQQDIRELVGVVDKPLNGKPFRVLRFKYVLADGRTHLMNEGDPDQDKPVSPEQMQKDIEEAARLRAQGVRDVVGVLDRNVEGQVHRTLICRYMLADGREITIGEGDPSLAPPTKVLTGDQVTEAWRLKELGEGETLEPTENVLYDKTFVFENRLLVLADGTVVTLSSGTVKGDGWASLTDAELQELRGLIEANAGEVLSVYEQEVRGRVFRFERKRYTLSDGTQVVQAEGKPKEAQ